MKTQTTRKKLTPEFKAKVVIEALREQSTLAVTLLFYETKEASSPTRFNQRKGTQAPHYLLFCLQNERWY